MQVCKLHWEAMRSAIRDRGLEHLVAQPGQDWDPLLVMNYNFIEAALTQGGAELLAAAPENEGHLGHDGNRHYCPLCEAEKHLSVEGVQEGWIDACADVMLQHARNEGLLLV